MSGVSSSSATVSHAASNSAAGSLVGCHSWASSPRPPVIPSCAGSRVRTDVAFLVSATESRWATFAPGRLSSGQMTQARPVASVFNAAALGIVDADTKASTS